MPSANLVTDPTMQTHAALSADCTLVDNGDGTFRVDCTGQGSSNVVLDLSEPLDPTHRYEVTFPATGQPHNLKGQLFQDGFSPPVSVGIANNLFAPGTYDYIYTFTPANGRLKVWNYLMSGTPFSFSNPSVIDLDA